MDQEGFPWRPAPERTLVETAASREKGDADPSDTIGDAMSRRDPRNADAPERPETPANAPPPSESPEVDDSLILWMLSLTPTQRLEVAQGFVDSVQILRNGRKS